MAPEAHSYARRHLATHAAAAGVLDDVLTLENLPYLDQSRIATLLRLTNPAPGSSLWLLLSAWRSVRHRWSWDDPDGNAAALDVAFLAAGGFETPPRRTLSGLGWRPRWVEWAAGGTVVAGDARQQLRIALGLVGSSPSLATSEGWQVQLWDPATGQPMGEPLQPPYMVRALAFTGPPGLLVAACEGGRVVTWDAVTRLPVTDVAIPETAPRALAVGDVFGRWLAAVGGVSGTTYVVWVDEAGTGQDRIVDVVPGSSPVRALAFDTPADGPPRMAIGYGDGRVDIRTLPSWAPAGAPIAVPAEIDAVALGAVGDRRVVVVGTQDGVAELRDADTGEPVIPPWVTPERCAAWRSPR